jgi:hypothetical protein
MRQSSTPPTPSALADEAGLTLIQMAVAFATRHPAVTSAIIGPRTMEHLDSYLAADGIELSSDLLDRIDQIVPPGVTINVADNMWNIGAWQARVDLGAPGDDHHGVSVRDAGAGDRLVAYLAVNSVRVIRIGRERLRQILHERQISFQRTRTWKESADPDKDAKLDRIEEVTELNSWSRP